MISPSAQHNSNITRGHYPPEMFELVTDILADLVLEDLNRYPQVSPAHGLTDSAMGEYFTPSRRKVKHERIDLRP